MALKVGLCFLLLAASALGEENCFKHSEHFLSKMGVEVASLEKGVSELSSFMKDVMWNTLQMEMRLRQVRMEMDTFRQISMVASAAGSASGSASSSASASASASALAHASASAGSSTVGPSQDPTTNASTSTSSCSLQQLLKDQFKGNVLIEIKAAPASNESDVAVTDQIPLVGELTSCSAAPQTGIYRLKLTENRTIEVLCDADFEKGGWVVIQYRFNGTEEFYRNWTEYQNGFGSLREEFWLGNDNIYQLTAEKPREIAFLMEDFEGNKAVARYASFKMGNSDEKFTLKSLGTYSGSAGDSLSRNVGSKFTTYDMDNDKSSSNCALLYAAHDGKIERKHINHGFELVLVLLPIPLRARIT
uniref:Fibrinogen C-terminal domain-containing protein n=1 Tax=Anopheles farauti TaxID=69004 RepID=A0A182Q8X6_9DIPT